MALPRVRANYLAIHASCRGKTPAKVSLASLKPLKFIWKSKRIHFRFYKNSVSMIVGYLLLWVRLLRRASITTSRLIFSLLDLTLGDNPFISPEFLLNLYQVVLKHPFLFLVNRIKNVLEWRRLTYFGSFAVTCTKGPVYFI